MFKEFLKKYEPDGIEKLSKARRSNIKRLVFSRINENEKNGEPVSARRFKPAFIAAAAAVLAITGVTVGALSSPPEVKLNEVIIEPYYTVYQDVDGSMVEIMTVDMPPEMLSEELPGMTPVGELRLGRSEIGDISKDDYFGFWLIDENGDEYCGCINNKVVDVKITYPDNVTEIYGGIPCNLNTEHHYCHSASLNGYEIVFLPQETEVCGYSILPRYSVHCDDKSDALIEIFAMKLPEEILEEPITGCYFPIESFFAAKAKLFDESGSRITPVITNQDGTLEFPDGINDLLIEIKVTYPDGSVETTRVDPINKLEGFNYDEIEFNYLIAKYENMFENDHNWLRDDDGNAVYQGYYNN